MIYSRQRELLLYSHQTQLVVTVPDILSDMILVYYHIIYIGNISNLITSRGCHIRKEGGGGGSHTRLKFLRRPPIGFLISVTPLTQKPVLPGAGFMGFPTIGPAVTCINIRNCACPYTRLKFLMQPPIGFLISMTPLNIPPLWGCPRMPLEMSASGRLGDLTLFSDASSNL